MILGFNPRFPDKILSGGKTHTIREDKHNRWKAGMLIHFATGVRTAEYKCFNVDSCDGTQTIEIRYMNKSSDYPTVIIDGRTLLVSNTKDWVKLCALAKNDGFDSFADFCKWFNKDFKGKIIHWTDLRY